jgi:hypothetical protein
MQHKTQCSVQFAITPVTRDAWQAWIEQAGLKSDDFIYRSGSTIHLTSLPASTPGSSGARSTNWA